MNDKGKGLSKKAVLAIVMLILAVFSLIVLFSSFFGDLFGRAGEAAALIIIGAFLAYLLYRSHRR